MPQLSNSHQGYFGVRDCGTNCDTDAAVSLREGTPLQLHIIGCPGSLLSQPGLPTVQSPLIGGTSFVPAKDPSKLGKTD